MIYVNDITKFCGILSNTEDNNIIYHFNSALIFGIYAFQHLNYFTPFKNHFILKGLLHYEKFKYGEHGLRLTFKRTFNIQKTIQHSKEHV